MDMSEARILINGEVSKQLSVLDRGLHYGDGLFETIAVKDGRPLLWQQHSQRLQKGCESLKIPFPDIKLLQDEANQLCQGKGNFILKLIITRGEGGRGYRPPTSPDTNRILALYDWPEYPQALYTKGIQLHICNTRMSSNPALAGLKHLNRLEQVLARSEWDNDEIFEGLLLDRDDNVIEGTMSNIFIINDNKISTPELSQCGIDGIIRNLVLEIAADFDLQTETNKLSIEDVLSAGEIFITNSIIGLVPVKQIGNKSFDDFSKTHALYDRLLKKNYLAPL